MEFDWDIRQAVQLLGWTMRFDDKRGKVFAVSPDGEYDIESREGITAITDALTPHFRQFVETVRQDNTLVRHDDFDHLALMHALGCTLRYSDGEFPGGDPSNRLPSGWWYKDGREVRREWGYWIVPK